ncbi:hypothetical protein EBR57_06200, partial [bacterium]|nr:hypothetical protein [bacterium]
MIVLKKTVDNNQKMLQERMMKSLKGIFFRRTLQKTLSIPFSRGEWPTLHSNGEPALHEKNPVFFPDDVPRPLIFKTRSNEWVAQSASTTGNVNGGSYHIHSPDRFDAQALMAYYVRLANSYGLMKPLLSFDTETSGVKDSRRDAAPSIPWEVGWHAGGLRQPEAKMLRLPEGFEIPASTAFAIGPRAGGEYAFHNTPLHQILNIDSLLGSMLQNGMASGNYQLTPSPDGSDQ